jgi:hypothetical protein
MKLGVGVGSIVMTGEGQTLGPRMWYDRGMTRHIWGISIVILLIVLGVALLKG